MNKDTGAGKGDKLRRGVTQDEWEKKWEKIFGKTLVYSLYNSFGSELYFCNSFTNSIHSGFIVKNLLTI